jgi:AcrR family transcriptional regulator
MSAPARSTFRHRALRSDAAANRDRLLAAAAVAVTRDGEKVAMATVAADAGVGVATLYRHYPTREALLSALAARSLEIVLGAARRAAANPGAALASLLGFLDEAPPWHPARRQARVSGPRSGSTQRTWPSTDHELRRCGSARGTAVRW